MKVQVINAFIVGQKTTSSNAPESTRPFQIVLRSSICSMSKCSTDVLLLGLKVSAETRPPRDKWTNVFYSGPAKIRPGKFHKLMDNAQYMACMAKIWATEQFSVLSVDERPVDADAEPVSAFLQERAAKMIPQLEGPILEHLKTFTKPKETKITSDLSSSIGSALVIAVWAVLWQMMLTYRSALQRTLPGTGWSSPSNLPPGRMLTLTVNRIPQADK